MSINYFIQKYLFLYYINTSVFHFTYFKIYKFYFTLFYIFFWIYARNYARYFIYIFVFILFLHLERCLSLFRLLWQEILQAGQLINDRNLVLTVLETGCSKIKVPARSSFGEGLLLGFRLPTSPWILTWQEGWGEICGISLRKTRTPFIRVPPSWPTYLPKSHLLLPSP